jgi:tetratricopeptide (TPR) repeat protein
MVFTTTTNSIILGIAMPNPSKRPNPSSNQLPRGSALALLAERPQIDFEMEFFEGILARLPDFAEVLRAQGANLTTKGLMKDGLKVDQKLVEARPTDPTAHYNLACRYAVLKQRDLAIRTLRRAVELGYRDFDFMRQDSDLEVVHKDPRFRQLLREFGGVQ